MCGNAAQSPGSRCECEVVHGGGGGGGGSGRGSNTNDFLVNVVGDFGVT